MEWNDSMLEARREGGKGRREGKEGRREGKEERADDGHERRVIQCVGSSTYIKHKTYLLKNGKIIMEPTYTHLLGY